MGRTKGTYTLTSNIEPKVGAPLDARTVVPLKTDLTANGTFDYPYIGLSVFVREDNKRYTLIGTDPTVEANWREEGSGTSTSADHVTYDNTTSELESTNVQDAIDEIVDNLGSAAYKDVPESGNADATQVVMGNDSRLTDSRNANDVYPWAKSVNKPSYTYSEIQNTPTLGTAAAKDYTNSVTEDSTDLITSGAVYDALENIPSDDTWRNIKVNGTEKLGTATNTGAVDFVNGTNTTVSFDSSGNKIKIDAVDTTYEEATTSTSGLMSAADKTKLNGIATGAEVNVQSDWNQTTTTADDYIKNKPTLGTAATKNVPTTGNASTTEVVMGSDTRLTDSRPASDVHDWAKAATKPTYTKSEVGLGNVDNTSDATKKTNFTGSIASGNTGFVTGGDAYTALNSKLNTSLKGAANGLAELDADGKVPSSQLPSYVDDIIEVADYAHLPITGESGKIYVTLDTNLTYRWSGTGYTEISESLALGETESTAYRGDRGRDAYNHATETKLSTATASGLYKVAGTAQGHIASLTAVTKTDITALGIPGSDTNTHRPIQMNGTEILGNNTTVLNLKAGSNVTLSNDGGTVTINSSYSNTDVNVTQTATTTNANYEVLFSATADNTTRTEGTRKNSNLLFNPNSGALYADGYTRRNITGQTLDLNTLTLSAGTIDAQYYIEKTDGGCNNITNRPVIENKPFLLDVESIRWASTTDYITRQTYRNANNPANEYVRFCTNGTWGSWTTRVFTDTKYTAATAAPGDISSSAGAAGTSTNYARQDHTHKISLATGDANGQVKIAGTNVDVKGLGSNAYSSTAYLPLTGGTMTGSLTFANGTKNVVGDDCAMGDFNVGGVLGIQGQNGTTAVGFIKQGEAWNNSAQYAKVSYDGSNLALNVNYLIQKSNPAITLDNTNALSAGADSPALSLKLKTADGSASYTTNVISFIGTNTGDGNNIPVRIGSSSGTTIISAGEAGVQFAAKNSKFNDENLYLVSDSSILLYKDTANDGTISTGPLEAAGFTGTITSGRVVVSNGTRGGLSASSYTIATSVPANAVFTDQSVTASSNHYTPATVSGQDKSASATGATAAWSIDVVKGVTLNTDGKGHVTGISVTSGKIPANPVPSNNITGSGTSGYIAKFNGTNTITNGPAFGSATTTYLRNDGTWATPPNDNTDTKVTQTATSTSAAYEVLFSETADNTTRTEGARKNSNLLFNPNGTGTLYGVGEIRAVSLSVSTNNGTSGGISLYNNSSSMDDYGIMFRKTSNKGVHGYVQADWATYFTMDGITNRGWVFKTNGKSNVASINNDGNAVFNGSVTVGGNAANTSGMRFEYDSTNECTKCVFVA